MARLGHGAIAAVMTASIFSFAADVQSARAQQAWPNRTVRVITPQPPGTAIDLTCRIFAQKLSEKWKQPVVLENRPGGDGITGVSAFVNAGNDHTLLCSFGGPITISPFTAQTKLPYDPSADLKPISVIADFVQIFGVSNIVGIKTLAELKAKVQAEPGKLNWSATQGLPLLLFSAWLRSQKLDMVYVPYASVPNALQDLAQGRIQAYATSYGTMSPLLESDKARLLVTLNGQRAPQAPELPTAKELGIPELTVVSFNGFFAPKEMAQTVIERIAADIAEAGRDPEFPARFAKMGSVVRTTSPAEFTRLVSEQRATVEAILKATGGLKAP